jgi:mono/diheme cytochrome c family protein
MLKINFGMLSLLLMITTLLSNPSYAANPINGGEIYNTHCADCHGSSGISTMPGAPNFAQNESLMQSDASLLISIQNGNNAMPAYQGVLSDHDILDVITYLRTLN